MKLNKMIYIFLIITPLLLAQNANAGRYGFISRILRNSDSGIKKLAKEIAPKTGKLLKKADIRKIIPDIPLKRITPGVEAIVTMGKKFTDQGRFATKFINSVPNPGEVLRQASKYGTGYLKTAKNVSKAFIKHSASLVRLSKKQLSNGNKKLIEFLPKFKNQKFVSEKFVDVLKKTGKKGYKITSELASLAKKYPKSAAFTAGLAWYMVDPESFTVALRKSGQTVTEFVSKTFSSVSEGVGHGLVNSINDVLHSNNLSFFMLGFLGLTFFIKPVRRFALIPFRMIGNKMENFSDKCDDKYRKKTVKTAQKSDKIDICKKKSSSLTNDSGGSNVFD